MSKVLDEKSGKMVTEAQAKVLAVLDMPWLDYATTGLQTSDASFYDRWVAEGRNPLGVSRPTVHYGSASALEKLGLVQIYHDYMDRHEFQIRRIEKARV
jgi:hypothetical protein